jgi:glyoxalase/bleomycin resistance protein/dioxygenase superfamily protein
MATRSGSIHAVSDVDRSLAFYRDLIGFEVEATYDDPDGYLVEIEQPA